MIINIYIDKKNFTNYFFVYFLYFKLMCNKYSPKIITSLKNISPNSIIIPISHTAQKNIYKNNIYKILDDKVHFYSFFKNNYEFYNKIKMIKTYDKFYNGDNIFSIFIIKKSNSLGSMGNKIVKGYIYDLINKYTHNYQIQDLLKIKQIYSVDYTCFNGDIYGTYVWKTMNHFPLQTDYIKFVKDYLLCKKTAIITNIIDNEHIKKLTKQIIEDLNYNGFINFEFLIDTYDNIYIMECNPRLSGCIINKHFFNNIIIPYINKKHSKSKKFTQFNTLI